MGTKLRDQSTLKKVINVWQTYGMWNDSDRISLIEAETSYGQTVFCSSSRAKNNSDMKLRLGRAVTEEQKAEDFHILDYEPDMTTFKQVSCSEFSITAVDQNG